VTTLAAMRDAMAAIGATAGTAAAAVAAAASATRDDFALCPPGVHSMFDPCPGNCADPLPDEAFAPELPPAPAEHGPGAARRVAQALADAGEHSHLAAYGETVCISRQCGPALDALRGLL
jgi:hypothetical protein